MKIVIFCVGAVEHNMFIFDHRVPDYNNFFNGQEFLIIVYLKDNIRAEIHAISSKKLSFARQAEACLANDNFHRIFHILVEFVFTLK